MAKNPDFLGCIEEMKQRSFFKVLNSVNISSENMRAIPHDFAKCFSDDELSGTMKLRTQWGRSWEVKISKNPRFYFMERSGWEIFVKDNALGNHEFLTFTHKGRMHFTVNIMHESGKEILKPPQTRTSRTSSRHDVKKTEEVVVSAGLSPRGPRTEAESSGRGKNKRKLNVGNKKAEGSQSSKRAETEGVVGNPRDNAAGLSSFSGPVFNVYIKKSLLRLLPIPMSRVRDYYMPRENTMFKINHPDGKKSWDVHYVVNSSHVFSAGWMRLCKEYPVAFGDTCKFTFVNPHELLLVVSKP